MKRTKKQSSGLKAWVTHADVCVHFSFKAHSDALSAYAAIMWSVPCFAGLASG